MSSRLPPQSRDSLTTAQQSLHDHFHTTLHAVLGGSSNFRQEELGGDEERSDEHEVRQDEVGNKVHSGEPERLEVSAAPIAGPFPFLAILPRIGKLSLDLLCGLNEETPKYLPLDAREVIALVCGAKFGSTYASFAHGRIALEARVLSEEQVRVLKQGKRPGDLNEGCELAHEVAETLLNVPGKMGDEIWDKGVAMWGKKGMAGAVHYVALFSWTSMVLNAAGVEAPKEG
jgi:hypothetical protein